MVTRSRIPFLIVGGGIGGLATALAAAKANVTAHVLERAPEFTEIGAGLQLGPNAIRMLDHLGAYGEILKHSMLPRHLIMRDAITGRRIVQIDLDKPFLDRFKYPYVVMHRSDLLDAELGQCRSNKLITLENNKDVVFIEDLGDGARVRCADGSAYECDALVGADGFRSSVRKIIHDDGEPICAGSVAYRSTVPLTEVPDGTDLESMTIWVGPDLHFVQYVVRPGELLNQVAVFRSAKYSEGNGNSGSWGTIEELDEHFSQMCAHVRNGVAKINRDKYWVMYDRMPIANWTRNRITLLGDAAHPILQYIAQGACLALEDAVCLGNALQKTDRDFALAFQYYQSLRIERTSNAQRTSRFVGELYHLQGVGAAMRDALLARNAPEDYTYLDRLYGYTG